MTTPAVLFVDDEAPVLRAMQRIFRKNPLTVLTAASAAEGLDVLNSRPVSVVVSDQRMAGLCGTDFLKLVREQFPDTVRCILSGYAQMEAVVAAINDGHVYRFIAKPWDDDNIRTTISDCVSVANQLASERRTSESLRDKATALQDRSARLSELIEMQESILKSSRNVLDQLPIGVAALDGNTRLIYTNRAFSKAFGHLPGMALGQAAGEPWASIAMSQRRGETQVQVGSATHHAHIGDMEIGGQTHTLVAMYPRRK